MKTKLKHWLGGVGLSSRSENGRQSASGIHQAAILHIDIVGSTRLVGQDLELAHRRIRQLYTRLCRVAAYYGGIARELRGDAAVVEFAAVEDAIRAALAIHTTNGLLNGSRIGKINPDIRSGISYGPIISEDRMITGLAVIRAQRVEQLAEPGRVLLDQSAYERIREPREFDIGEPVITRLKGFDDDTAIYSATAARTDIRNAIAAQLGSLPSGCGAATGSTRRLPRKPPCGSPATGIPAA